MKYARIGVGLLTTLILLALQIMPANAVTDDEYEYMVEKEEATLTRYLGDEKSVTVPCEIAGYKVKKLSGTFYGNDKIENVVISEGITIIGLETFYGCVNLEEVTIASTVNTLGDYAFAFSGIEEIWLPEKTHLIGEGCFWGCSKLELVESDAKPFGPNVPGLVLRQYAFAGASIKVIKTECTPLFYDNTFTTQCIFTDNDFVCYVYTARWLAPVARILLKQNPTQSALLTILLGLGLLLLLVLGFILSKFILYLFGKDSVSNYNRYSKQVFEEIAYFEPDHSVVWCKKKVLLQDTIIKAAKVFFTIVVLLACVWIVFVACFKYVSFGGPIVDSLLKIAGILLGSFALMILLIWAWVNIRSYISGRKIHADMPRVRVRRVGRGGRNNAV